MNLLLLYRGYEPDLRDIAVKFRLKNPSDESRRIAVQIAENSTYSVDAYVVERDGRVLVLATGSRVPVDQRLLKSRLGIARIS
jgi:hypothetical protein